MSRQSLAVVVSPRAREACVAAQKKGVGGGVVVGGGGGGGRLSGATRRNCNQPHRIQRSRLRRGFMELLDWGTRQMWIDFVRSPCRVSGPRSPYLWPQDQARHWNRIYLTPEWHLRHGRVRRPMGKPPSRTNQQENFTAFQKRQ